MDENRNAEQAAEEVAAELQNDTAQDPAAEPQAEQAQPDTPGAGEAAEAPETPAEPSELEQAKAAAAQEHENYLRLAAEYDNFRKRSQKEKDNLYTQIRAETVGKFLPVFDNLERALAQQTADEAYKKGVEMTMTQLVEVMTKLGVESFGEKGEAFDPALHNAVMHVEDETLGENVIKEVFQKGFRVADKVIRFAMVTVAN